MDLSAKRALVTGGGQRVGAAIARRLAEAGADVVVHFHRSREGADAVCEDIKALGRRAFAIAADLSDADAARGLVSQSIAQLGGLDVLVSSAANYEQQSFESVTSADLDHTLALNLRAPLLLAQQARDALRESHGSIVIITCTSPHAPYRDYAPYIVSKGALHTLMKVLAVELAPQVRVNAVAPGTVLPPSDLSSETLQQLIDATPLQREGSAADVADAVLYLATAPFVTGVEITVDGGRDLTRGLRG